MNKNNLRDLMMDYRMNIAATTYTQIDEQVRRLIYFILRRTHNTLPPDVRDEIVDDTMPVVERLTREFVFVCPECREEFQKLEDLQSHGSAAHAVEDLKPCKMIDEVVKFKARHYALDLAKRHTRRLSRLNFTHNIEEAGVADEFLEMRIDVKRFLETKGFTLEDVSSDNMSYGQRYRIMRQLDEHVR